MLLNWPAARPTAAADVTMHANCKSNCDLGYRTREVSVQQFLASSRTRKRLGGVRLVTADARLSLTGGSRPSASKARQRYPARLITNSPRRSIRGPPTYGLSASACLLLAVQPDCTLADADHDADTTSASLSDRSTLLAER